MEILAVVRRETCLETVTLKSAMYNGQSGRILNLRHDLDDLSPGLHIVGPLPAYQARG